MLSTVQPHIDLLPQDLCELYEAKTRTEPDFDVLDNGERQTHSQRRLSRALLLQFLPEFQCGVLDLESQLQRHHPVGDVLALGEAALHGLVDLDAVLVLEDLLTSQVEHVLWLCELAEEELELGDVAHLELLLGGLGQPRAQRVAALGGDRVCLPASAFRLDLEGEQAQLLEPLRLGVELGVRKGPEVAHRVVHSAFQVVRRARSAHRHHAEHDVRRGGQFAC